MSPVLLAVLAAVTVAVGATSGVGGAVILVPALIVAGTTPTAAAPIGMATVAAGALAAGPGHIRARLVHHRLGVVMAASAVVGALAGAIGSDAVSDRSLSILISAIALLSASAIGLRSGLRHRPDPLFTTEHTGEWTGLPPSGAYLLHEEAPDRAAAVVGFAARRTGPGVVAMFVAGALAGLSGTGGGYLKTPIITEVVRVPVRVAAATTTFILGITSATALTVYAAQGRVESRLIAAAVVGAVGGGVVAPRLAMAVSPVVVRRVIAALLVAAAIGVLAR